jgi:hypothetical protein
MRFKFGQSAGDFDRHSLCGWRATYADVRCCMAVGFAGHSRRDSLATTCDGQFAHVQKRRIATNRELPVLFPSTSMVSYNEERVGA